MADEVEDVADVEALFALPPEGFTAARDGLARRLRAAGDREAAAEVKALRRPTVAAWALNQLVRRHPEEVDALVEAGAALAAAQQQALEGDRDGLREASRARTATVRRLTGLAEAVLGDRATEAHRRELTDALTAASGDPGIGEALREGRLREPPTAAAGATFGFGLGAADLTPSRPSRPRTGPRPTKAAKAAAERADAEARAAARATAEATASARRDEADRAAGDADEARAAATAAEARVEELAAALAEAQEASAVAEARATAAEATATDADEAATTAEEALAALDP